jgi:hypothetical protein
MAREEASGCDEVWEGLEPCLVFRLVMRLGHELDMLDQSNPVDWGCIN